MNTINMKIFSRCLVAAVLVLSSACSHSIHLVQVSDYTPYAPLKGSSVIKANSEQFAVMGFVDNTQYVNQAYERLQEKCTNGRIQGITTQFSTSHGFFSWTNKILMQGFCIKG